MGGDIAHDAFLRVGGRASSVLGPNENDAYDPDVNPKVEYKPTLAFRDVSGDPGEDPVPVLDPLRELRNCLRYEVFGSFSPDRPLRRDDCERYSISDSARAVPHASRSRPAKTEMSRTTKAGEQAKRRSGGAFAGLRRWAEGTAGVS